MAYDVPISRANPGCFIFLVDQSSSMMEHIQGKRENPRKCDFMVEALNKTLANLIVKATKSEDIPRRYYQVGVIGYGSEVGSILGDSLGWQNLVWIDELYQNPLRIEERLQTKSDGAGGFVEVPVKFPVWFDPIAMGNTPMCQALDLASSIVRQWVKDYPESYPPIVLNLTDGEANDGDPRVLASQLTSISTTGGNVLLFTSHVSANEFAGSVVFPSSDRELPDLPSRVMFEMTSLLPNTEHMRTTFQDVTGEDMPIDARLIVYNGGMKEIVQFLDIGTSTAPSDRMNLDP